MSKLSTMFGGFGLAAAMVAVAVTGCDPYTTANTAAPEILGVLVADLNLNGIQPAQCSIDRTLGCGADFDCSQAYCQLANGGGTHTACTTDTDCTVSGETCLPQTCTYPSEPAVGTTTVCGLTPVGQLTPDPGCIYTLPRRAGTIWGPGYPAVGAGGAWTVTNVPVGVASSGWPGTAGAYVWAFGVTRIIFNKVMDGTSIQKSPVDLSPPTISDLKIDETVGAVTTTICNPNGTPAVPCQFDVWYDPSSPTPNYGAAMVLVPGALYNGGLLLPSATYHITVSTVMDQQARTIPIDVTVTTVP